MNKQREAIYSMRDEILFTDNPDEFITNKIKNVIDDTIELHISGKKYQEEWDWDGLQVYYINTFLDDPQINNEMKKDISQDELFEYLLERALKNLELKKDEFGELYNRVIRFVSLQTIDTKWRDHLYELDALKEGIGLRGYAQKDPLIEYKRESFHLFQDMIVKMDEEIVAKMFRVQVRKEEDQQKSYKKVKERKKIKRT
jgi:preprotein translocase subunit SecA